jgi:hypothetical protein
MRMKVREEERRGAAREKNERRAEERIADGDGVEVGGEERRGE